MSKRPSERGWDILSRFVQERVRGAGPDADLAGSESAEELEAAADGARRLLKDAAYQRLRLEGLREVVADFVSWLNLDPSHVNFERELKGLHLRAAPRYWSLFRPEEVIYAAKQRQQKEDEPTGKRR